jgi:hypothetical protein
MFSERSKSMPLQLLALALALLFPLACSSGEEAAHEEHATEEHADHEGMGEMVVESGARIYFVTPVEGDEVTSPVKMVFGSENYTIEPRVEGVVNPGAGHHHIGINTHCLPAGEVIPSAEPWVHFGDGSNEIEVQLPPGEHHISLQAGDGDHRTLDEPGLCQMINITVVE